MGLAVSWPSTRRCRSRGGRSARGYQAVARTVRAESVPGAPGERSESTGGTVRSYLWEASGAGWSRMAREGPFSSRDGTKERLHECAGCLCAPTWGNSATSRTCSSTPAPRATRAGFRSAIAHLRGTGGRVAAHLAGGSACWREIIVVGERPQWDRVPPAALAVAARTISPMTLPSRNHRCQGSHSSSSKIPSWCCYQRRSCESRVISM
jgi:hypothetical protein